jgi:hypothetical protein
MSQKNGITTDFSASQGMILISLHKVHKTGASHDCLLAYITSEYMLQFQ